MAPLNEQDRENLVAYLDGELDEDTTRSIEARLNTDPAMRAEADALKQAWELLDYLPRAEPSSTFTHRTMERLALHHPGSTMTMPAHSEVLGGLRLVLWAGLGIVAALGIGFVAGQWWTFQEQSAQLRMPVEVKDVLLEDLSVIENMPMYQAVDNVAFLKKLNQPELFAEEKR